MVRSLPATWMARDRSPLSAGCGMEDVPFGFCLVRNTHNFTLFPLDKVFLSSATHHMNCELAALFHILRVHTYCVSTHTDVGPHNVCARAIFVLRIAASFVLFSPFPFRLQETLEKKRVTPEPDKRTSSSVAFLGLARFGTQSG